MNDKEKINDFAKNLVMKFLNVIAKIREKDSTNVKY